MKKKELETQETTMHQMLINFIRCARLGNLTLGEVENAVRKQFMIDALQEFQGHQQKAAKALGIHRNTFGRAVDKFDINVRGMVQNKKRVQSEKGLQDQFRIALMRGSGIVKISRRMEK